MKKCLLLVLMTTLLSVSSKAEEPGVFSKTSFDIATSLQQIAKEEYGEKADIYDLQELLDRPYKRKDRERMAQIFKLLNTPIKIEERINLPNKTLHTSTSMPASDLIENHRYFAQYKYIEVYPEPEKPNLFEMSKVVNSYEKHFESGLREEFKKHRIHSIITLGKFNAIALAVSGAWISIAYDSFHGSNMTANANFYYYSLGVAPSVGAMLLLLNNSIKTHLNSNKAWEKSIKAYELLKGFSQKNYNRCRDI